jgi:hypothetical protein
MKSKKWFTGILATVFALSLAGAASAQGGVCGRGQGGGRGVCVQSDQSQSTSPNYQKGRGKGQGRQQRLRDGSCVNNPNTQAPAATPAPTLSN